MSVPASRLPAFALVSAALIALAFLLAPGEAAEAPPSRPPVPALAPLTCSPDLTACLAAFGLPAVLGWLKN